MDDELLLATGRFRVVRRTYRLPDGTPHQREIVEHNGAVVVLPLLPGDRLCLIRNYRVAVGQTLIELPAGTLDDGEDPAAAARRELAEETGYTAQSLRPLLTFYMSPGILHERMHLFVAEGLTAGAARPERGEQIESHVVTWPEALEMIGSGKIVDAKTIVALLYYERTTRAVRPAAAKK